MMKWNDTNKENMNISFPRNAFHQGHNKIVLALQIFLFNFSNPLFSDAVSFVYKWYKAYMDKNAICWLWLFNVKKVSLIWYTMEGPMILFIVTKLVVQCTTV